MVVDTVDKNDCQTGRKAHKQNKQNSKYIRECYIKKKKARLRGKASVW